MSKQDTKNENPFGEGYEEAQAGSFVKWDTIGQQFKGTYNGSYEADNALSDKMQKIYEFIGESGDVNKDEEVETGKDYRIGTRGDIFDRIMKTVVVGQKVAFLFADEIPSKKKGNNPFKLIKVYKGELDPNYQPTVEIVDDIKFED